MTDVRAKKYDYEDVIKFTNTGGELDQALTQLQEDLKQLRIKINECEPLYHGKGTGSQVYKQYQYLYANIGNPNQGLWNQVQGAAELQDAMYSNALGDKERDERQ